MENRISPLLIVGAGLLVLFAGRNAFAAMAVPAGTSGGTAAGSDSMEGMTVDSYEAGVAAATGDYVLSQLDNAFKQLGTQVDWYPGYYGQAYYRNLFKALPTETQVKFVSFLEKDLQFSVTDLKANTLGFARDMVVWKAGFGYALNLVPVVGPVLNIVFQLLPLQSTPDVAFPNASLGILTYTTGQAADYLYSLPDVNRVAVNTLWSMSQSSGKGRFINGFLESARLLGKPSCASLGLLEPYLRVAAVNQTYVPPPDAVRNEMAAQVPLLNLNHDWTIAANPVYLESSQRFLVPKASLGGVA